MDWSVRHKLLLLGALKRCGPEDWSGVAGLLSTHPWFEPPVLEEKCRSAYFEIVENFSELKFDSSFILDYRYNMLISTLHKEYTEVLKNEIEATKEKLSSLNHQNEGIIKLAPATDRDLSENDNLPVDEVLTISEQENQKTLPFSTEEIHVPLDDSLVCSDVEMAHSTNLVDSVLPLNCSLEKKDFQQFKAPSSHQKDTLKSASTSPLGLSKLKDKETTEIVSDIPQKALSIQHKRTVAQPLRLSPLKKRLVNYSYRGLTANSLQSQEIPRSNDSTITSENDTSDITSPKKVNLPASLPLVSESKKDTGTSSLFEETSFLDSSIHQNETLDSLEQSTSPQVEVLPCSPGADVSEKILFENEERVSSKNVSPTQDLYPSDAFENSLKHEGSSDKNLSNSKDLSGGVSCSIPQPEEKTFSYSNSSNFKKRPFLNSVDQTSVSDTSSSMKNINFENSGMKLEEVDNCTGLENLHDTSPLKKLRCEKTPGLELLIQDDTPNDSLIKNELLEDLETCEISPAEVDQIISPVVSISEPDIDLPKVSSVEHERGIFDSTDLLPEKLNESPLKSESKGLSPVSQLNEPLEILQTKTTDNNDSNISINSILDESHVSINPLQEITLADTSVDSCLSSINTAGVFACEENSLISTLPADASIVSNSFDTNVVSSPLTIKDDSSMVVGAEANIEDLKASVLKDDNFPSDHSNHSPSPEPQEFYNKTDSDASPSSSSSFKDDYSVKSQDASKVSNQPSPYSKAPEITKRRPDSTHNLTIDVLTASRLSHTPSEETAHDRARLDSPGYKKWKKLAFIVFKEIANHRLAPIFQRPIKESVAPGYFSIVKCPMDLSTIQNRIKQGIITTTEEFSRDLLLMCGNALMFNRADSEIYGMAKEMLESVEMHLKTLHAADLYHSTTPAAPTPQPESAHSFS